MFTESISNTVFYFTSIKSAHGILSTGKVNLTPTVRNDSEEGISKNKLYFMSLTRSRHGEYHKNNSTGVLFELDGVKLSQNFSGQAVDYWDTMKNELGLPMKDEMEDRVYTNHSTLNIIKYVKNISILYDTSMNTPYVLPLYIVAKKLNIPIFAYTQRVDWLRNNTENSITLEQLKDLGLSIPKPYNFRSSRLLDIVALLELHFKKKSSELSSDARKLKQKARNVPEFKKTIMNDIHNNSGSIADGASKEVQKLLSVIKSSKYANLQEFLNAISLKWKDIDIKEERVDFLRNNRTLIREFMLALNGEYAKVDFSVFGDDTKTISNRIRNLLYGMLRNDVLPNEDLLGYEINNDMSGYRVETTISEIVDSIMSNVVTQSS